MIHHLTALLALVFLRLTCAFTAFDNNKQSSRNAKSKYVNQLVNGATPVRKRNLYNDYDENEMIEADLSSYYIRFEKCQFVKTFSDESASKEVTGRDPREYDTVLVDEKFVIFRLCPDIDNCDDIEYGDDGGNGGYGEYMIDMETYLLTTVEYKQEKQEEMCEKCDEKCNDYYDDDDYDGHRNLVDSEVVLDVTCSECVFMCEKIGKMEENFYVDATYFITCEEIVEETDEQPALYAGPMCSTQGSKIKIGVFSDEDCTFLNSDKDVDDYLADENGYALKLSHALLKQTYDNNEPIFCGGRYNNNGDDTEAAEIDLSEYYDRETKDVCMELYDAAAKCESPHGFDNGYDTFNDYSPIQADNEMLVCMFIDSVLSGTYTQEGEIVIGGTVTSPIKITDMHTTKGQICALSFFILGTIGLAVYAAKLNAMIGKADASGKGIQYKYRPTSSTEDEQNDSEIVA